jgi:exopolysaccharide production protein ExoZ
MYKSLQACRGFAALMVVFYHARGAISQPKYFGASTFGDAFLFGGSAGVDFFFVLSGFIIIWIHAKDIGQPQRLGAYLMKRAIRIYPTYWIIFSAVCAAAIVVPALRQTMPGDPWTLLKALLLVPQGASSLANTGAPVLTVAWSLQYEVLFYAFIALAIVSPRACLLAIVPWAINFLTCRNVCSFPLIFFADFRILLFVLGGLIARLCATTAPVAAGHAKGDSRKRAPALAPWVDRAALALGVLGFIAGATWQTLGHTDVNIGNQQVIVSMLTVLYGLASGFIIFGAVKAEDRGVVWGARKPWQVLGGASYALYLIHYPVISLVTKVTVWLGLQGAGGALLAFSAAASASVALAVLFHLRVEQPMLRTLNAWRWPMPGAIGNPKV